MKVNLKIFGNKKKNYKVKHMVISNLHKITSKMQI